MSEEEKSRKRPPGRPDSFGSALGPDFVALGRRIVIKSARDNVKLKRRRKKPRNATSEGEC